MDDSRIVKRIAQSLGLRREDVRYVARKKESGRYYAITLLLPSECSETSYHLADAINDAINIEAGLGNGAFLDFFGARHVRFSREANWYEKLIAALRPSFPDKKYAYLTRALAFADMPEEGETNEELKDRVAVIIITSCRRDGKALFCWKHDADRTEAILLALEKHEERLRTIIRHAAPSHHLLEAPVASAPVPVSAAALAPVVVAVVAGEGQTSPVWRTPKSPYFAFAPAFSEPEPVSVKINV